MKYAQSNRPLLEIILQVAGIWIFADFGYYLLGSIFAPGASYSTHPILLSLYYLVWVGMVSVLYAEFYDRNELGTHRTSSSISIIVLGGLALAYFFYVIPILPSIRWNPGAIPPVELLRATPWYFLPKSIEILLQQFLLVAFVEAFNVRKFSVRAIQYWCAGLFGSIHLLLIFDGGGLVYVSVFTAAATAAGFIFPYLMLKVKNGLLYSYFLHWTFYAVIFVIIRFVF